MKDGLIVEYSGSSAIPGEGSSDEALTWESRYLDDAEGEATDVPNAMWRGAHFLLLDSVGVLGNVAFLLCAALEEHYDFNDGCVIRTGELRVIPSTMVSLIQRSEPPQGPSEPLRPNRAQRRGKGGIIL